MTVIGTAAADISAARILLAGVGAGVLDLAYATILGATQGRSFARVWQGVASGWVGGAAARDGGWATAALGVLTHFGIAICMAAAFAVVASRAPILYRSPAVSGVAYGLTLYLVMYRIVLPLRFPQAFPRWDGLVSSADIAAHIGVALVIVFVLARGRATAG